MAYELREHQRRALDMLYDWMRQNKGNPCVVLPTGAGKSVVIAELCREALTGWPETRILMITHAKELIEQNAEKLRSQWPNVPMGIYSASVGSKDLSEPITYAGIQSIHNRADDIGYVDLVVIDECHAINHEDEGIYRKLLNNLKEINPDIRVIGFTATPWRLNHGLITDKPAIFDALIEPVTIEELIDKGWLAPLRSKVTNFKYNTDGVKKRGGEYVENDLQRAVDTDEQTQRVVSEALPYVKNSKACLVFCCGILHAENVAEEFRRYGVRASHIDGGMCKGEREGILRKFKNKEIDLLTNCNLLTTGFDYPDIDLILMMRPTMSPILYVQMVGRGLRLKSHTDHCLVLDYAGVVSTHGPITNVIPPQKKGKAGNSETPVKVCDVCSELVHLSARKCPACGNEFPPPKPKEYILRQDDIMGIEGTDMAVRSWFWSIHKSRINGKSLLSVAYTGFGKNEEVSEMFPLTYEGVAGQIARSKLKKIASQAGFDLSIKYVGEDKEIIMDVCKQFSDKPPPKVIEYKKDGKYIKVIRRDYTDRACGAAGVRPVLSSEMAESKDICDT